MLLARPQRIAHVFQRRRRPRSISCALAHGSLRDVRKLTAAGAVITCEPSWSMGVRFSTKGDDGSCGEVTKRRAALMNPISLQRVPGATAEGLQPVRRCHAGLRSTHASASTILAPHGGGPGQLQQHCHRTAL